MRFKVLQIIVCVANILFRSIYITKKATHSCGWQYHLNV